MNSKRFLFVAFLFSTFLQSCLAAEPKSAKPDPSAQDSTQEIDRVALSIFCELFSLTDAINSADSIKVDKFSFKHANDGSYQMLASYNMAAKWYPSSEGTKIWKGTLTFAKDKESWATWFFTIENSVAKVVKVNVKGGDRNSFLPDMKSYLADLKKIVVKK